MSNTFNEQVLFNNGTQTFGNASVSGNLEVGGNIDGDVTGNLTGDVTGNLTGNINSSGISIINQLEVGSGGAIISAGATISGLLKVGIGDFAITIDGNNGTINGITTSYSTLISGIATFVDGPVVVGAATAISSNNQKIQVIGGACITQNVGIGTTNPIANLDVIGNARITGDTTITGILTVGSSSVTIDGNDNLVKANSIQTTSDKPILNSSGSVINVYTKIDTTQAFYNTTADVDLTGLAITLTPTSINSKFILHANIVTTRNFVIAFGFKRGTTKIGKSATDINAGLGTGFTHIYHMGATNDDQESKFILDNDTPSTTSPVTYTPFVKNSWNNVSRSWYYNNRNNDDMGSTSVFTIYEVVG